MKKIAFLIFLTNILFAQSTIQERGNLCNPKDSSSYTKMMSQRFVTVEDKEIKETTNRLSSLSIRKRTVTSGDKKESFILFTIYTFLSINSSKYIVYENALTIDEAKTFLLDLINMEEEIRKRQSNKSLGYFTSYTNTKYFIKSGFEYSQERQKSTWGYIKKDKNGDDVLKNEKNWFIDVDTSCGDNRSYYKINDILEFIETLRNTINA